MSAWHTVSERTSGGHTQTFGNTHSCIGSHSWRKKCVKFRGAQRSSCKVLHYKVAASSSLRTSRDRRVSTRGWNCEGVIAPRQAPCAAATPGRAIDRLCMLRFSRWRAASPARNGQAVHSPELAGHRDCHPLWERFCKLARNFHGCTDERPSLGDLILLPEGRGHDLELALGRDISHPGLGELPGGGADPLRCAQLLRLSRARRGANPRSRLRPRGEPLVLCPEGFTTFGIEGSARAAALARERLDLECRGWRGRIDVGDFIALPYPEAQFDGVLDNESVCHNDFVSSCAVYREAARVLKQHGKLFVRTFATGTWGDGTGEPMGRRAWCVAEGPMLGKGLSRFTDEADFGELFPRDLTIRSCDLLTRTIDNRAGTIREWILVLEKTA